MPDRSGGILQFAERLELVCDIFNDLCGTVILVRVVLVSSVHKHFEEFFCVHAIDDDFVFHDDSFLPVCPVGQAASIIF